MYLSDVATWGLPKHPLAIANETTDDGETSGRGLIAIKGIIQGEPIFEVPYGLIITKDVAVREIPVLQDAGEYIAIATFLVRERARDDSFWKPYLDILPDGDDLIPLFRWTDDEMALLEGSPCVSSTISLRSKLEKEFADAEEKYFVHDRHTFPEDVFTLDEWIWAFAILFSRAIMLSAEQMIALVPYADLLNHNPFCSTYIDAHQRAFTNEKYVALYTDRPYSKMDQVYVTYGPKSNADLLLLYGFVSDRNPYDAVELIVSLAREDPLYDRKKTYLEQSGVKETTSFPLYRDRYPMELIEFLRFCVASEEEFDSDFGDFISVRNETLVAETIIRACRAALSNYPCTREEDDKIMRDRGMFQMLGLKQRWAVRHRRSEKRILERMISNLEQEMEDPTFMFTESKE